VDRGCSATNFRPPEPDLNATPWADPTRPATRTPERPRRRPIIPVATQGLIHHFRMLPAPRTALMKRRFPNVSKHGITEFHRVLATTDHDPTNAPSLATDERRPTGASSDPRTASLLPPRESRPASDGSIVVMSTRNAVVVGAPKKCRVLPDSKTTSRTRRVTHEIAKHDLRVAARLHEGESAHRAPRSTRFRLARVRVVISADSRRAEQMPGHAFHGTPVESIRSAFFQR